MSGRTPSVEEYKYATAPHGRARGTRLVRILVLAMAILSSAQLAAQEITFFRIGTGASAGTYFAIGALLANAISNPPGSRACEKGGNCGVPGVIAVAQSTEGSLANLEAISQGELESGLAEADIAYWAYNGGGPYLETGELENLSSIANLYPESVHVVVRRGSGITRISHLKGKRVSVGPEGSGTSVHAKAIVEAYGLTLAELKVLHLQPGPASDLLRERGLDAFFAVAGYPVNAITSLAETMRIGLIDMTGEPVERLVIGYPFLTRGLIPAGTYKGVLRTPTLNVGAQWVVGQSVEADLVYDITRALWHENTRHLLDSGHPDGARIRLETALRGLAIPLHPGAERYYREIGMIQ